MAGLYWNIVGFDPVVPVRIRQQEVRESPVLKQSACSVMVPPSWQSVAGALLPLGKN
jgi:hypothetical protein